MTLDEQGGEGAGIVPLISEVQCIYPELYFNSMEIPGLECSAQD